MKLLMILVLALIYQVEPVPANHASGQSESPENNQAAPAVKTPNRSTETDITSESQKAGSEKIKRSEWAQILISGIVALVVLWQAWLHYDQRKAGRIGERGYVGIKTSRLVNFNAGRTPSVQIVFLNGGRTPVWNLYTPAALIVSDTPPDDDPLGMELPSDETGHFLVAGEDCATEWFFPEPVTVKTVNEILGGLVKLYIKGEAWFEDCWGEKRQMPFYLVYDPQGESFVHRKRYAEYIEYQTARDALKKRKRV
jgi:hypothetical protein